MPSSRTSRRSPGSLRAATGAPASQVAPAPRRSPFAPRRSPFAPRRSPFAPRSPTLAALTAFVTSALAAHAAHAAPPPRSQARSAPRTPPPPALPSLWTAPTAGPWRLPTSGDQVAFLDARHAVVLPTNSLHPHSPMLVDLSSGLTPPPAQLVGDDAGILHLARVGNRLLGFGLDNSVAAAWHLTLQGAARGSDAQLVATSLDPPPPPAGTAAEDPGVIVSPDERWLIWCHSDGPPTLRDATTLRILRTLTVASCKSPVFTAPDRVRLGDEEVELPSGMVRPMTEELTQRAGPRRRLLEIQGDYVKLGTVRDGKKIVQRPFELTRDDLLWTPDGVAISLAREALSLRPAADGSPRTMRPRLRYSYQRVFAVSSTHALIVDGPSLELVDLTTGESKSPEGNLDTTTAVTPFAGAVATAADRLRLWRGGQLVSEEEADLSALRTTASRLVAIDSAQQVWLWDPGSGLRRWLGQVDAIIDAFLTTAGEDVWFGTQYTLEHSRAGQPARAQARFRVGLAPLAYHPRGLFALGEDASLLYVADLASGRARQWRLADQCELVRDGLFAGRMMVRGLASLHVVDLDGGEPQIFETPGAGYPYLAVSAGEDVAIADDDDALFLWHVGDDSARQIPLPLAEGDSIRTLRFSLDGTTLALGTNQGGVISVAVAEVKQHGQRVAMPRSQHSCFHGEVKPASFMELGLVVNERPGERTNEQTNEKPAK